MKCVVCQERPARWDDGSCVRCAAAARSVRRRAGAQRVGGATAKWLAARARRFERKRAKLRMDARLADVAVVERALLDKAERAEALSAALEQVTAEREYFREQAESTRRELRAQLQAKHDATARRYNAALDRLHAEVAELERARDEARAEARVCLEAARIAADLCNVVAAERDDARAWAVAAMQRVADLETEQTWNALEARVADWNGLPTRDGGRRGPHPRGGAPVPELTPDPAAVLDRLDAAGDGWGGRAG